jgi:hypothetical protein
VNFSDKVLKGTRPRQPLQRPAAPHQTRARRAPQLTSKRITLPNNSPVNSSEQQECPSRMPLTPRQTPPLILRRLLNAIPNP